MSQVRKTKNIDLDLPPKNYPDWDVNLNANFEKVDKALGELDALKAPIKSPEFTDSPKATTPAKSDNSKRIATTEFVKEQFKDITLTGTSNVANLTQTSLKYAEDANLETETRVCTTSPSTKNIPAAYNGILRVESRTSNIVFQHYSADDGRYWSRVFRGGVVWTEWLPIAKGFHNVNEILKSANLTGIPTAPTAAPTLNNGQLATTGHVQRRLRMLGLEGAVRNHGHFRNEMGLSTPTDANDYDATSLIFIYNLANVPSGCNYGWLQTSYFDGAGFVPSSGRGNLRQIFTDWASGRAWVRVATNALEKNYTEWGEYLNSAANLTPTQDAKFDIGSSSRRFRNIYASTSVISTSDKNDKENVKRLEQKAVDFIMDLKPVEYEFRGKEYLRTHYGLIAQEVEEAMYRNGMNSLDFAGLTISPITEEVETDKYDEFEFEEEMETLNEESGEVTINKVKKTEKVYKTKHEIIGQKYGLRYEEFIAPLIKTVQVQQSKISELGKRLEKLERLIPSE